MSHFLTERDISHQTYDTELIRDMLGLSSDTAVPNVLTVSRDEAFASPALMQDGTEEPFSEGLGSGSEFRVTLPQLLSAQPNEQARVAAPVGASSTMRILVVDDNRDSAISLSILLNLSGHETSTAFDGEEALATEKLFHPDVVLLDIGMPKLNGYEVCRALRAMPRERPLVIVALTGWGQDDDRRKSMEAGFDAHLVKPVDPDALQRTLKQLVR